MSATTRCAPTLQPEPWHAGSAHPDPGCARLVGLALADGAQRALFDTALAAPALLAVDALPASVTRFFGFECQLDGRAGAPDILLCSREQPQRDALAAAAATQALGGDPAWQRIAPILREWADGAAPWARGIHNVWLEFDSATASKPPPSLFFGTLPSDDGAADVAAVLGRLGITAPAVNRVLGAMPPTVFPFQFGAMLGRMADAVRLCVRGWPLASSTAEDLSAALQACGHAAATYPALPRVMEALSPIAARLDLGFDLLGSAIGPRLHLEWPAPDDPARVDAYLDVLAEQGFCTMREKGGMRAWHGITHERRHPTLWPEALRGAQLAPGGGASALMLRRLHHVKLVLQLGKPIVAKAYLAAHLVALEDARLKAGLNRL